MSPLHHGCCQCISVSSSTCGSRLAPMLAWPITGGGRPAHVTDTSRTVKYCSLLCAFGTERWCSPAAESGSEGRADAGGSQGQHLVRCCAGAEECPRGSVAQKARAYGQSRGVMPFSCAYLAAAAATRGRTSAWSVAIQSVMAFHCVPSHCWN